MPVRKTYPIKITLFLLTSTLIFLASTFALASNNNVPNNSDSSIPYCVDPDWFPFEAIKDGKHIGISSDYIKYVAMQAGLNLVFLPTKTWQETLDNLKEGKCHITPNAEQK